MKRFALELLDQHYGDDEPRNVSDRRPHGRFQPVINGVQTVSQDDGEWLVVC